MIVVIKNGTPVTEITRISEELYEIWGVVVEKSIGQHKIILGIIGDTGTLDPSQIQEISPWIEQVLRVERPFKRASREFRHGEPSEVVVSTPNGPVSFGEEHPIAIVAGPCSVENKEMIVAMFATIIANFKQQWQIDALFVAEAALYREDNRHFVVGDRGSCDVSKLDKPQLGLLATWVISRKSPQVSLPQNIVNL